MKGLFKHFLLSALLIFHTSFGSVMAAQMQTSHLKMGGFDSSLSDNTLVANVASVATNVSTVPTIDILGDVAESKPCPHHSKNMTTVSSASSTITQVDQTISQHNMMQCSGHDCSNCHCVNALSSIPTLTVSFDYLELDRSNAVSFTTSTFPESPLDFILRPPIS